MNHNKNRNTKSCFFRRALILPVGVLAWFICQLQVQANPIGPTVSQGVATFSTSGSQFTINQTSGNAFINWQSFNIGSGENHDLCPALSHFRDLESD